MTNATPPCVITLGTAGGPRWWRDAEGRQRSGIATAVIVGDSAYVVDCGQSAAGQLARAGVPISAVRGVFLTHLHSDHIIDLAALTLFGSMSLTAGRPPIQVVGPGDRGMLPPVSPRATSIPQVPFAEHPTPGTTWMFHRLMEAYATDTTDRILDSLRPGPHEFFTPRDIQVPAVSGYHPNTNPAPAGMEPFEVYRDEHVVVTATLVQHAPVAPAFAFRFDAEAGSVTISGDTAPCDNLVRLARDTDLLLHEAIDFESIERSLPVTDPAAVAATMDHHRNAHTSPVQAGELASRAGARRLALHHLVPANADPRVWLRAGETYSGPLHIPDDLERIGFGAAIAAKARPVSRR